MPAAGNVDFRFNVVDNTSATLNRIQTRVQKLRQVMLSDTGAAMTMRPSAESNRQLSVMQARAEQFKVLLTDSITPFKLMHAEIGKVNQGLQKGKQLLKEQILEEQGLKLEQQERAEYGDDAYKAKVRAATEGPAKGPLSGARQSEYRQRLAQDMLGDDVIDRMVAQRGGDSFDRIASSASKARKELINFSTGAVEPTGQKVMGLGSRIETLARFMKSEEETLRQLDVKFDEHMHTLEAVGAAARETGTIIVDADTKIRTSAQQIETTKKNIDREEARLERQAETRTNNRIERERTAVQNTMRDSEALIKAHRNLGANAGLSARQIFLLTERLVELSKSEIVATHMGENQTLQLRRQADAMRQLGYATAQTNARFGFMQDVSVGTQKSFRAMSSASQGMMLGMSAMRGDLQGLAFSLIFLQFSGLLKLSLMFAAATAGVMAFHKVIKGFMDTKKLGEELGNVFQIATLNASAYAEINDINRKRMTRLLGSSEHLKDSIDGLNQVWAVLRKGGIEPTNERMSAAAAAFMILTSEGKELEEVIGGMVQAARSAEGSDITFGDWKFDDLDSLVRSAAEALKIFSKESTSINNVTVKQLREFATEFQKNGRHIGGSAENMQGYMDDLFDPNISASAFARDVGGPIESVWLQLFKDSNGFSTSLKEVFEETFGDNLPDAVNENLTKGTEFDRGIRNASDIVDKLSKRMDGDPDSLTAATVNIYETLGNEARHQGLEDLAAIFDLLAINVNTSRKNLFDLDQLVSQGISRDTAKLLFGMSGGTTAQGIMESDMFPDAKWAGGMGFKPTLPAPESEEGDLGIIYANGAGGGNSTVINIDIHDNDLAREGELEKELVGMIGRITTPIYGPAINI